MYLSLHEYENCICVYEAAYYLVRRTRNARSCAELAQAAKVPLHEEEPWLVAGLA